MNAQPILIFATQMPIASTPLAAITASVSTDIEATVSWNAPKSMNARKKRICAIFMQPAVILLVLTIVHVTMDGKEMALTVSISTSVQLIPMIVTNSPIVPILLAPMTALVTMDIWVMGSCVQFLAQHSTIPPMMVL